MGTVCTFSHSGICRTLHFFCYFILVSSENCVEQWSLTSLFWKVLSFSIHLEARHLIIDKNTIILNELNPFFWKNAFKYPVLNLYYFSVILSKTGIAAVKCPVYSLLINYQVLWKYFGYKYCFVTQNIKICPWGLRCHNITESYFFTDTHFKI